MKKLMPLMTYPLFLLVLMTMASLYCHQAYAVEGLSANVGLTNNYLWRGITQTDDAPAVSGGIDFESTAGFYAGTWVSNIDFNDNASYELDFYLGIRDNINQSSVSYDVGYIYYTYPDSTETDSSNEYDFGEIYGSLTYSHYSITANYGIHYDQNAKWADKALYISLDAQFNIYSDLTLGLHVGNAMFNDAFSNDDYTDYSISLNKNNFTLLLSDTDANGDNMKVTLSYVFNIDL